VIQNQKFKEKIGIYLIVFMTFMCLIFQIIIFILLLSFKIVIL